MSTKPKSKLIPPDRQQCQAERREGCWPDAQHFMIIGPRQLVRCKNNPTVIVQERKPGADGECGSMSLCTRCFGKFCEQNNVRKFIVTYLEPQLDEV